MLVELDVVIDFVRHNSPWYGEWCDGYDEDELVADLKDFILNREQWILSDTYYKGCYVKKRDK